MTVFNLRDGELEAGFLDRPGYDWRSARLGARFGARLLGMSVYELDPGRRSFPHHYHLGIEEWLIVLSGRPTLRCADRGRELAPGDVVVFPEGPAGAHQVRNDGEEPARFAILSNLPTLAAAVYPDSGKLGVRAPALQEQHLVRDSPQVDYWEGEE